MNSRRSGLGGGFFANMTRLIIILTLLGFLFGPMSALFGTEYQWLSIVIGALMALSVLTLLFKRWKIFMVCLAGFLAANLSGGLVMLEKSRTGDARAAYVDVAGRDPSYAVLFPDPLRDWLSQFTPGLSGQYSSLNDRPFNGQQRFISVADVSKNPQDGPSVYYLATSDLDMTEKDLVDSYREIASEHGDWLGFMARCVHSRSTSVPLLPQYRDALKLADRIGSSVCNEQMIDKAFGIDPDSAGQAYLSELGISRCEESRTCMGVKQDLKLYGDNFFPG